MNIYINNIPSLRGTVAPIVKAIPFLYFLGGDKLPPVINPPVIGKLSPVGERRSFCSVETLPNREGKSCSIKTYIEKLRIQFLQVN